MTTLPLTFDRPQIAAILQLSPATVKNWSSGKPLTIMPSVRAPGRRGAQPIYSIEELYLYAIARSMTLRGITFDAVNQILPRIQRKWLASDERGHLVVARLDLDEPLVRHFSKKLDEPQRAAGILRILLSRDNEGAHVFTLGRLLDWADERIAEVEGRSNEAKEKQT